MAIWHKVEQEHPRPLRTTLKGI